MLTESTAASDETSSVVRRTRTMRQQPHGYVRSFIDNHLIDDIEDCVIADVQQDEEDVFADNELSMSLNYPGSNASSEGDSFQMMYTMRSFTLRSSWSRRVK